MLGSDSVFNAWRLRRQAATFKGTLLGIVVSFFIIIFLAYLLNLAPYFAQKDAEQVKNSPPPVESASREKGGPVSFLRGILGIRTAQAATPLRQGSAGQAIYQRSDYKAQIFITSALKLELKPGEEATYRVGFKNIGAAPWLNSGTNFVSIYTFGPKYRKSVFQDGWYKPEQPVKLKDKTVKTGQLGYIEFKLKAPTKEGEYTEIFKLAAEDRAWIEGGEFSIPITVIKNKLSAKVSAPTVPVPVVQTDTPATASKPISTSNFQGMLMLKSADKVQAKAGEVVDLRFGFKNTGKVNWDMQGLIVPQEDLEGDGNSLFYYPTWASGHQSALIGVSSIKPGELGFLDFKIKAPEATGTYNARFQLVVNYDKEVDGGVAEIPVYVTDETIGADQSGRVTQNINMAEPVVEVGLGYMENSSEAVELTSNRAYQLTDKAGNFLASFAPDESVRATYNFSTRIFTIQNARLNLAAQGELHFKGLADETIFTILSMSRPTSYGQNDNQYRDEIILRYTDTTDRLWTINRLPMEHYLWGIAETSDTAPMEFIKANIVAARTYALYHYLNPYKWNNYFTVVWTVADQYYRGYGSELRRPHIVQAANETKGQVVTYQGDIVVTPYFGHSDGRTRGWAEVWGGKDKPWLKSVPAPYDAGKSMFGHGVGMSQTDAYGHAKTDGWDYTKILKYYYSGVEVSKVY